MKSAAMMVLCRQVSYRNVVLIVSALLVNLGEAKPSNNKVKFFQRIKNWHKSIKKKRWNKYVISSGESKSSCGEITKSIESKITFPEQTIVTKQVTESTSGESLNKSESNIQQLPSQQSVSTVTHLSSQKAAKHRFHWIRENVECNNEVLKKKELCEEYQTVAQGKVHRVIMVRLVRFFVYQGFIQR